MMAQKTYHAVLVDDTYEVIGQIDGPMNPRFFVLYGSILMGGDEQPTLEELPVSSRVFHRVGSAVFTSEIDASTLYELVEEKL